MDTSPRWQRRSRHNAEVSHLTKEQNHTMTLTDTLEQVRITCRMRRLSRHTEDTYAGWIARFARHVSTCADLNREERVRSYLEKLAPRNYASA
jgi:hypothetical protein